MKDKEKPLVTYPDYWPADYPEGGGHGFTVEVSPEFIEVSRKLAAKTNVDAFRKNLAIMLRSGNYGDMIQVESTLINLSEKYGLESITISGQACQLYLEKSSISETRGATYTTHNVDFSRQFTALFGIFNYWANDVLREIDSSTN